MRNIEKYKGIVPAFYACYDDNGKVSPARTREMAEYLIDKGVQGLYVNGSSGECIYLSVAERKQILESVLEVAKGRITVIAHVGCNNTADSVELAAHAEGVGVDAIASIPPIYFKLPDYAIAEYWNAIGAAAPNTDFFLYNIPQTTGVELSVSLYKEMLQNPQVVGVKNSSLLVQDIQNFKAAGGDSHIVYNGPDEQLASGLAAGADGGIGGTYSVMPELLLKIKSRMDAGDVKTACQIQADVYAIIGKLASGHGNLYSIMKGVLRLQGIDVGDVRKPLPAATAADQALIQECYRTIEETIEKYKGIAI